MKLITVASGTPFTKKVEDGMKQAEVRAKLRRNVFEKPRDTTAKRLQKDVQKIAKDEVEFSKRLFQELIPIEITIDKDATGLKALFPVNIAFTNREAPDIKAKDTDKEPAFDGSDAISAYLDDEIIP